MTNMHRETSRATRVAGIIACIVLGLAFVAACSGPSDSSKSTATSAATTSTAAAGSAATPTGATSETPTASSTATSAATSTATATSTAQPSATSTGSAVTTNPQGTPSTGSSQNYLDDRSTAEAVIQSYYNAINAKQYARAYSYWESGTPTSQLPPFDQFQQGYTDTLYVGVTLGPVHVGAAAGNLYYSVPVQLDSKTSDNGEQTFVGCYTLHLGNPANQTEPPFHSMAIQSAKVDQVASIASAQDLLDKACQDQPGGANGTVTPPANPDDISASNYLDNRSDGAEVIRSFYNAINSRQYARAYAYWEPNTPSSQLAPFDQFQQGYAQTKSVALTIGQVQTDAGAGQRYWSVPTTIVATMNDGSTQTFVGCYDLHLASPDIQTQPPFQPLGIQKANVSEVDNNADTTSLMAKAGQP
jgi:hypothetical protein